MSDQERKKLKIERLRFKYIDERRSGQAVFQWNVEAVIGAFTVADVLDTARTCQCSRRQLLTVTSCTTMSPEHTCTQSEILGRTGYDGDSLTVAKTATNWSLLSSDYPVETMIIITYVELSSHVWDCYHFYFWMSSTERLLLFHPILVYGNVLQFKELSPHAWGFLLSHDMWCNMWRMTCTICHMWPVRCDMWCMMCYMTSLKFWRNFTWIRNYSPYFRAELTPRSLSTDFGMPQLCSLRAWNDCGDSMFTHH